MPVGPKDLLHQLRENHVQPRLLTSRQCQVWAGLAMGMPDVAIAAALGPGVTERTVTNTITALEHALFDGLELELNQRPAVVAMFWLHIECANCTRDLVQLVENDTIFGP